MDTNKIHLETFNFVIKFKVVGLEEPRHHQTIQALDILLGFLLELGEKIILLK